MFHHPEGVPLPQLTYVGCLVCDDRIRAAALGAEAVRLAGLPPSTLVDLWEQASSRDERVKGQGTYLELWRRGNAT